MRMMTAGPAKRRAAFTLIEMLLVVLLLGVVTGLSLAGVGYIDKRQSLKRDTYELYYLMQSAQSRSMFLGGELRLVASPDNAYFWLEKKDKNGYSRLSGNGGRLVHFAAHLRVAVDGLPLTFFPDGSLGGAEISICSANDCYVITTKELFARIKLIDWTVE